MRNKLNSIKSGVRARHVLAVTTATVMAGFVSPTANPSTAEAATRLSPTGVHRATYTAKYQYAGKKQYRYGGANPRTGFDCSGMTKWLYGRQGVYLPHSSAAQYKAMRHISRKAARPGDLAFFVRSGRIYHVALYVGNNQFVEALNPRLDVRRRTIPSGITMLWGTKRY